MIMGDDGDIGDVSGQPGELTNNELSGRLLVPSATGDENTMTEKVPSSTRDDGIDNNARSKPVGKDSRYPLVVPYCNLCGLPAEFHEYHSRTQFDKCRPWMAANCPELFPNEFSEEAAAKLKALEISDVQAEDDTADVSDKAVGSASSHVQEKDDDAVKVAVPIEQKGTVGKKKKLPAEIVVMLAQRKGKKQVTIVYGLDLFGIKLADAAKAAKKKFATGASIAHSADNRDVVEIQGTWQEETAELVHKVLGIPKPSIFIVDPKTKKKHCPFENL